MKKSVIAIGSLICLGGLVGCQNSSYTEELEAKIKEQENYIEELNLEMADLQYYKEQKEHQEQQARRTQQLYEEEQKRLNEEKYYIALTDILFVSKHLGDKSQYFDYGQQNLITLKDVYCELSESGREFTVNANLIKSGQSFKMSEVDKNEYFIFGNYEEIEINTEAGDAE